MTRPGMNLRTMGDAMRCCLISRYALLVLVVGFTAGCGAPHPVDELLVARSSCVQGDKNCVVHYSIDIGDGSLVSARCACGTSSGPMHSHKVSVELTQAETTRLKTVATDADLFRFRPSGAVCQDVDSYSVIVKSGSLVKQIELDLCRATTQEMTLLIYTASEIMKKVKPSC